MKIDYDPHHFRMIRLNPKESRVLFRQNIDRYAGATQISAAQMRMNADAVTNQVVDQIKKEFSKAFDAQANFSISDVENLLMEFDNNLIKIG